MAVPGGLSDQVMASFVPRQFFWAFLNATGSWKKDWSWAYMSSGLSGLRPTDESASPYALPIPKPTPTGGGGEYASPTPKLPTTGGAGWYDMDSDSTASDHRAEELVCEPISKAPDAVDRVKRGHPEVDHGEAREDAGTVAPLPARHEHATAPAYVIGDLARRAADAHPGRFVRWRSVVERDVHDRVTRHGRLVLHGREDDDVERDADEGRRSAPLREVWEEVVIVGAHGTSVSFLR